jgi:pentapeptide MXKDX repeat protein
MAGSGGMAERTNALVLKTRGAKTPVGSNPTAPATPANAAERLNLLKIVKLMETFAFEVCKLWVASRERRSAGRVEEEYRRRISMRRIILLVTAALLATMVFAPAALAQEDTAMEDTMMEDTMMEDTAMEDTMEDTTSGTGTDDDLPSSGGPAILLPAAALLLGSGILTFAVLRRR